MRIGLIVSLVAFIAICGTVEANELYFSGKDAGIIGKLMNEQMGSLKETETLTAAQKIIWVSEPMEDDTVFSEGKWRVTYWAYSPNGHVIYVRLYKVGENGLTLLADGKNILYGGKVYEKHKDFELDSVYFKKGERIAVEIQWSKSAGNDLLTLYFNTSYHPSRLETPSVANAIPEFPPLSLFMVAAIVIGSFVLKKR